MPGTEKSAPEGVRVMVPLGAGGPEVGVGVGVVVGVGVGVGVAVGVGVLVGVGVGLDVCVGEDVGSEVGVPDADELAEALGLLLPLPPPPTPGAAVGLALLWCLPTLRPRTFVGWWGVSRSGGAGSVTVGEPLSLPPPPKRTNPPATPPMMIRASRK
jgi:hypothetical protein